MRTKPKQGEKAIFEGHFSNGRVLRMSFWSPKGKPIDGSLGAALVTNVATAARGGPTTRTHYFIREDFDDGNRHYHTLQEVSRITAERLGPERVEAIEEKIGPAVYGPPVRVDGRWRFPACRNGVTLVRGYVEHLAIGRIEYVPSAPKIPITHAYPVSAHRS